MAWESLFVLRRAQNFSGLELGIPQVPRWRSCTSLFRVIKGIILHNSMGIIINHYKDPCKTNRIQWKVQRDRFFVAQMSPKCQDRLKERNLKVGGEVDR